MAATIEPRLPYRPDYDVLPGEILRETISALGMSQVELGRRAGLSSKHVNQIIQGGAPITPETALALDHVTGVPAAFWARLEANHQARKATRNERAALDPSVSWLDLFPVRVLRQRGFVTASDPPTVLQQVLSFFGVASVGAWQAVWMDPDAAFLGSTAFSADPYAIAVWLRIGELEAVRIECEPFDRVRFQQTLAAARRMTTQRWTTTKGELTELCRGAGVALVFAADVGATRASGASRWLSPSKALIELSLRHKREDHVWFAFFHEAAHVLLHGKRQAFVDQVGDNDTDLEREANQFASNALIPAAFNPQLSRLRTLQAIEAFAATIDVDPGIVVGRLQHDRTIPMNVGNRLRHHVEIT